MQRPRAIWGGPIGGENKLWVFCPRCGQPIFLPCESASLPDQVTTQCTCSSCGNDISVVGRVMSDITQPH
jgi:hypothetical protein